jgi:uncharacterized membrane protein
MENVVRFVLLLVLALLAGAMFGIWVGFNPAGLSATAYVEQQQNAIRSLNTLFPVLGAVCIVLAAGLAFAAKEKSTRWLLVAAVICLVVAAVVTRFGNQPINAVVITWNPQNVPPQWSQLRDTWWNWHIVRAVAAIVGLALSLAAVISSSSTRDHNAA